jgi:hypothetical protein
MADLWGLTVLMVLYVCSSANTEPPFTPGRATLEMLPSLKQRLVGGDAGNAACPSLFAVLIGPAYPASAGTAWDFHRSVWSAVMPRRCHQSPCRSAASTRRWRCKGRMAIHPARGFGRLGSVAYRPGRNVAPPELLLPGPSVSGRCRPLLAA